MFIKKQNFKVQFKLAVLYIGTQQRPQYRENG
jgi:hypothetical protein